MSDVHGGPRPIIPDCQLFHWGLGAHALDRYHKSCNGKVVRNSICEHTVSGLAAQLMAGPERDTRMLQTNELHFLVQCATQLWRSSGAPFEQVEISVISQQ
jgi:hypothetical protein